MEEKNRVSEGGRVNVEREAVFSLDYSSVLPTMLRFDRILLISSNVKFIINHYQSPGGREGTDND